jgi:uncharacterized protein
MAKKMHITDYSNFTTFVEIFKTMIMPRIKLQSSNIDNLVKILKLEPHPEGGYYKESYRSQGIIGFNDPTSNFSGERNYCTAIYYMLTTDTFSAFHRIKQDEIWHYYDGLPIQIHEIKSNGDYLITTLGREVVKGEQPQFVVPAGSWFGVSIVGDNGYALLGCTVAPGFDYTDFELADRANLISEFPHHAEIITRLTR